MKIVFRIIMTVCVTMKKLEERLPKKFMRIHHSYIINLRCIQEVNKNRVILHTATNDHAAHATATPDTVYLPIGDLYRDSFLDYLKSKFLVK
jgi:two-component system LytT family response regulator